MVVPAFGFAVGDFIATITLVCQALQALKDTSTAKSEYGETIAYLELVKASIDNIAHDTSSQLSGKLHASMIACLQEVGRFHDKVQKHGTAFCGEGDITSLQRRLKTSATKVKWAVKVKDEVEKMKGSVGPHLQAIILARQLEDRVRNTSFQTFTIEILQELSGKIEGLKTGPSGSQNAVLKIHTEDITDRSDRDFETMSEVKTLNLTRGGQDRLLIHGQELPPGLQSFIVSFSVYWRVLLTLIQLFAAALPRPPSWLLDSNIHLIDALGRPMSLPYETFKSWPMLVSRLQSEFKGLPGEQKISRHNFGIYRRSGRRELLNEYSWQSIKPGSKLVMSMIIHGRGFAIDQCPFCGDDSNSPPGEFKWSYCENCDLQHRPNQRKTFRNTHKELQMLQETIHNNIDDCTVLSDEELYERDAEEDKDAQYFKIVSLMTYPCLLCSEVFTMREQFHDHLDEFHCI